MNFKENAGVDPVTLSKGYTKLDGDPPNSGENILKPEHIEREKMYGAMEMDSDSADMGGFLERPGSDSMRYRPRRTDEEDQG